ncbi:sodium:solute symporter family protein [Alteribacillus iranensis]|uniref:Solute:Na+ symporter, SSS family n=1 Tax=Alteribacillus iranensis TaxID=930128 RepID=A0A1I2CVZ9_9BACI|nr:sodium:solute symporter family protein [Alteribacillus iranensis]SFE72464.1 solute:Na+ symporter, SSS family [Alteribacillus iranensis]
MPHWQIALVIMIGYLVVALFVGILAGRTKKASLSEYVVAGRKLGLIVTSFLMGGAVFSAFSFLGAPGWAFERGAPALYIIVYTAFAILPWYIIGPKIGKIGRKYDLYTLAGFLKTRFQSKTLAILVGIISLLAFIQYLATQMTGMAHIFNIMTEGRVPFWMGALFAYGIVVIYVATGGLRAAAWSDVFQGALMVIISWVVGIAVIMQLHGGTTDMFQSINQSQPGFLEIGRDGSTMSGVDYTTTILVSLIGLLMWPHLFSKSFSSPPVTIKRTVLIYPIFALFLIPLLLAGYAAIGVVNSGDIVPDQVLPYLITSVLEMPGWLYGLVGAGALAAAMSSADAITHSASLEFTNGVIHNTRSSLTDNVTLLIMRIAVVVIGGLAYCITIFGGQGLIALLLGAYGSIVQFAPGVYSALYWRRATAPAIITGLVAGTVTNFYFQLVASSTPFDIHAGIVGLIINIGLVIIVSYLTKPQPKEAANAYVEMK